MADKPRGLAREFVTSEGIDLRLTLGSAGERSSAFIIDVAIIIACMTVLQIVANITLRDDETGNQAMLVILLLIQFFLSMGYFTAFELGMRAATPGKRAMRLRVVARDGGRLTGEAVVARNAIRQIEVWVPLAYLMSTLGSSGSGQTWTGIAALVWLGIFAFFALFNRDRLRVGDLIAGTWVVRTPRRSLSAAVAASPRAPNFVFTEAQLDAYGEFELQKLEEVLRREDDLSLIVVARAIRKRIGWTDEGDDLEFLRAYYQALCQRLERNMLFGKRRADKYQKA
ncbi:RDD family protein [Sphingomonas sp. AOB5]|uniref:RDD family protein n=1 Tax=Sphingomonas sp. AOB5 TaxID=3034017 RepID=UPI0023F68A7E|nr:RDD family protein [Sphingomonas sp. AOB5]MDF7775668.1 RDD family protein [Sphingomonas sp. AOB5]